MTNTIFPRGFIPNKTENWWIEEFNFSNLELQRVWTVEEYLESSKK